MRAIVLSGGGARGAYQIGVWKALKKIGINYDIVTGTSIGSVNGLIMTQNDYLKALWLWNNIGFKELCDEEFPDKVDTLLKKTEVYKNYVKYFVEKGGISMSRMKKLLMKTYNEKSFLNSKINYGLVTFNLSKLEPVFMQKKDLKDEVIDYVLASCCCFPAFQKMNIDGEEFIDGGVYDNMPINMAIEMGAKEIIAVDLEAIGIKQNIKYDGVEVTYIKPKNDIGSFLVFDTGQAKRGIKYGYLDAMKVFNKLDGDKYTFRLGDLEKNYQKYSDKFLKYCDNLFKEDEGLSTDILKLNLFNRILKTKGEYEIRKIFDETVEFLGKALDVDTCKLYSINKFNRILLKKIRKQEPISKEFVEKKIKNKDFKKLLKSGSIVKYLYNALEKGENHKELCALALVFPKEFVGALYLRGIK